MPAFDDEIVTAAAPKTVWKLPDRLSGLSDAAGTDRPAGQRYGDDLLPGVRPAVRLAAAAGCDRHGSVGARGDPDREAHRLDTQRNVIQQSLAKLAELAEGER
jgi:hypothetical protein